MTGKQGGPAVVPPQGCPSENVLVDCLEGRLEPSQAVLIREHCTACAACAAAVQEYERLASVLDRHAIEEADSLWPLLQARLIPRRSPWARLAYPLGSVAAVAVGLLIGFMMAPGQDSAPPAGWQEETWVEMGSLLADPTRFGSLDDLYWEFASNEREGSR
jgi:predicted anti-sigma-YlaC factor YlaD